MVECGMVECREQERWEETARREGRKAGLQNRVSRYSRALQAMIHCGFCSTVR